MLLHISNQAICNLHLLYNFLHREEVVMKSASMLVSSRYSETKVHEYRVWYIILSKICAMGLICWKLECQMSSKNWKRFSTIIYQIMRVAWQKLCLSKRLYHLHKWLSRVYLVGNTVIYTTYVVRPQQVGRWPFKRSRC